MQRNCLMDFFFFWLGRPLDPDGTAGDFIEVWALTVCSEDSLKHFAHIFAYLYIFFKILVADIHPNLSFTSPINFCRSLSSLGLSWDLGLISGCVDTYWATGYIDNFDPGGNVFNEGFSHASFLFNYSLLYCSERYEVCTFVRVFFCFFALLYLPLAVILTGYL